MSGLKLEWRGEDGDSTYAFCGPFQLRALRDPSHAPRGKPYFWHCHSAETHGSARTMKEGQLAAEAGLRAALAKMTAELK